MTETKYMTETKKYNIGYNIPYVQYFMRFLKENNMFKKYINAFNQKTSLDKRKNNSASRQQMPTSEQLYNPLIYIDFVSTVLDAYFSRDGHGVLPVIVDQSIKWDKTIEGFNFWGGIWNVLYHHSKNSDEQITRIEKNIKLKEHEIYWYGKKYWI